MRDRTDKVTIGHEPVKKVTMFRSGAEASRRSRSEFSKNMRRARQSQPVECDYCGRSFGYFDVCGDCGGCRNCCSCHDLYKIRR